MISYTTKDLIRSLREVGVSAGDTVFLSARMYTVGRLDAVRNSQEFCRAYLDAVFEVIGKSGTLVVPTYTRQVGLYGVPYIHETTPTTSGMLNEFIRLQKGAVRSFHPIFSLTAIGAQADAICGKVGTSGFGAGSAYDHLFKNGGIALCLGFEYEDGHITTGAHYVATTYGVPYYYNKILDAEVYKNGEKSSKVFVLNVCYRKFKVRFDYLAYIEELRKRGLLRSSSLGASMLYACRLEDQLKVGYELLSDNVYAFLKGPPEWVRGEIPFDGCEVKSQEVPSEEINWVGYNLKLGGL